MSGAFPFTLEESVAAATALVEKRFPKARAAWLGGSVVRGEATATSDLDITVLLPGPPAPMRATLADNGIPVELFVHTEASLAHYRAKDQERRQPTMQRLVGESVVLIDGDGSGARLQQECLAEIASGPKPLSLGEVDAQRYALTAVYDDLRSLPYQPYLAGHAFELGVRLTLGVQRAWQGSGKGLLAALTSWLDDHDDPEASALWSAWDEALRVGDVNSIAALTLTVLNRHGGRLDVGYQVGGETADGA